MRAFLAFGRVSAFISMADFNLPGASVNRVLKEALPEGVQVAKDAKFGMNRAAATFVMYITTIAEEIAKETQGKAKKPVIKDEHILQALEEMDFNGISKDLQGIFSLGPVKRKARAT